MSEESLNKAIVGLAKELSNAKEEPSPIRYGVAKKDANGNLSVILDGADEANPTPAISSIDIDDRTRVSVEFINRQLVITGSTQTPAITVQAANGLFEEVDAKIGNFENLYASKAEVGDLVVETINGSELIVKKADIEALETDVVNVKDTLNSQNATISNLEANMADFRNLESDYADFKIKVNAKDLEVSGRLDANQASIDSLDASNVTITGLLDAQTAEIEDLKVTKGKFDILETDFAVIKGDLLTSGLYAEDGTIIKLENTYADIKFAHIGEEAVNNLYAKKGTIGAASIDKNGIHVAGDVTGIHIYGDVIEGNTIKAESLIIKGSDGLYHQLNVDGGIKIEDLSDEQQEEYNSKLHGSNIIANSITADQIYVNDLSALDATIGGFHITEDSIYSGVKESVNNTTNGIYMDDEGQISIGNTSSYLKFYKDDEGQYQLDISASSLKMSTGTLDLGQIDQAIDDASKVATNYLYFSDDGLILGDIYDDVLDKNVLIDNSGFKIRDNAIILANFSESDISFYNRDRKLLSINMDDDELSNGYKGSNILNVNGSINISARRENFIETQSSIMLKPQTTTSNNSVVPGFISMNTSDFSVSVKKGLYNNLELTHFLEMNNTTAYLRSSYRPTDIGTNYSTNESRITSNGDKLNLHTQKAINNKSYYNVSDIDVYGDNIILSNKTNLKLIEPDVNDNESTITLENGNISLDGTNNIAIKAGDDDGSTITLQADSIDIYGNESSYPGINLKAKDKSGSLNLSLYGTSLETPTDLSINNYPALRCGHINNSSYWGIVLPEGNESSYIRTPSEGIIPCTSGGSGYVGTSGWPFNNVYTNHLFQNTIRIELRAGAISWGNVAANSTVTYNVTFSKAFVGTPSVVCQLGYYNNGAATLGVLSTQAYNVTLTGCTISACNRGSATHPIFVYWIAMGRTQ